MFSVLVKMLVVNGLLLGFPTPQAPAQKPAAPATAATMQAPANGYQLGEDDVISITVLNFPQLSVQQVTIPPDGKINVPLLDPIDTLGKTPAELTQLLTVQWKRYVKNPAVSVALVSKRKENVFVAGFVTKAGLADYKPPVRVLSILTQMGGALPNGDLSAVSVTHKDGKKQTLDLSHPEIKAGGDQDAFVEVGDVIYVPERRLQVGLVGEVLHPGTVEYKENMTLLDALSQVGSYNRDTADLKSAFLRRDGKEIPLHLDDLNAGDKTKDIKLLAGDLITVPENKRKIYVYGAVQKPGSYVNKDTDHILDAIAACGGPDKEANLGGVNLLRSQGPGSDPKPIRIDLNRALRNGDTKYNVAIQTGDIIYVPKSKQGVNFKDFLGILNPITFLLR